MTAVFRRAYEALLAGLPEQRAELEYLRVLQLAAATLQHEVEAAIERLLAESKLPSFAAVQALEERTREIAELKTRLARLETIVAERDRPATGKTR